MEPKQRAADAAMEFIADGMVVGLGTGSTADFFLRALSEALKTGRLRKVTGIPTSRQSEHRAIELGIPLTTLAQHPNPDVTVDGADEVAPNLDLIKGLGGALLREKIVAQNSKMLVIIADAGKTVAKLGTKSMLPIEVVRFAHETQAIFLGKLGCTPVLRMTGDAKPFISDNGNLIYDCRFPNGIDDAIALDDKLGARAGIVETGLFLSLATVALIAGPDGVERRERGR